MMFVGCYCGRADKDMLPYGKYALKKITIIPHQAKTELQRLIL
jgi:hypothetical protein